MRSIWIIMGTACLAACTAAAPPQQPAGKTAGIQTVREGDFPRAAVKMVACISQASSKQNLAHNFVVGDTATVAPSYPAAELGSGSKSEYIAMALAASSDSKPLWMVIGQDTGNDQSHIVLKTGFDAAGHANADANLWQLAEGCGAQQ